MSLSYLNFLSEEICLKILSYLELRDIIQCSKVNLFLNRLTNDKFIWETLAKKTLGEVPKTKIKTFLIRDYLQKKANEAILNRIQAFIDRVSLGKNAKFRCFIPLNNRTVILSVEFKGRKDAISRDHYSYDDITNFDINMKYFAIGINNGFLSTSPPSDFKLYSSESIFLNNAYERVCIVRDPPFIGILRFPKMGLDAETEMEKRIFNIIKIKINHFSNQVIVQKLAMYGTAIAALSLGYIFISKIKNLSLISSKL